MFLWMGVKIIFVAFLIILKIKNFRNKVSGQVLRLALMSAHYKQPLDWNDKLLSDCQNTINKWYNVYLSDHLAVEIDEEILKPLYDLSLIHI